MVDTAQRTETTHVAAHWTRSAVQFGWTTSAIGVGAWIVFLGISSAVQPPPAAPAEPLPLSAVVVGLAFHLALLGAAVGFGMRRRYALWATAAGGLIMIGAAVMCYLGGHTGTWIAVQLASGVGLAATSTGLVRFS